MKGWRRLTGALMAAACALAAQAQDVKNFPAKPIRLVVPFAPGGTADTVARIVSDGLFARLGKPVVLDTRAGANSVVGCDIVAHATPDGHTLIVVAAGFAVNPSLNKRLPYDTLRDFAPVGLAGNGPYLLVIHAGIPANTVAEFVAWGKAHPEVSYASTGVGSPPHLAMELLKTMAGLKFNHIPYKGGGAVLPDLLSGRVPLHFASVSTGAPHVRAGRLKAIAMSTPKRSPAMPEVPTFDEAGLKGYDVSGWYGLLAPGKTPPALVNRLNAELQQVLLNDPEALRRFAQAGIEPAPGTPAQFAALIRAEIPKWAKVLQAAGIEPE